MQNAITDIVFAYIATSLLSAAAVGVTLFFPSQRFLTYWLNRSAAGFQDGLDEIARRATILHERLPPSVFLKPTGDEAALALNWTSAMAALMQSISSRLFHSLQWVRDQWS